MLMKVILFFFKYVFALAASVYLFIFGFIFGKHRNLILEICRHFGFFPGRVKPIIPCVPFASIMDENAPIYLSRITLDRESMNCNEVVSIIYLLKKINPKKVFELGTFNGLTTLNMAINTAADAVVYTIDLPQAMIGDVKLQLEMSDKNYIRKAESGRLFKGKSYAKKIVQLFGDTAQYDFSQFYGTIDMVFIDASHSYEYVKNDSLIALKLLRGKKGLILWHDYGGSWDGVTKALNELYTSDPDFKNIQHIENTAFAYLIRD